MYQELLEELGFTTNQAKVYEALLTLGETTANKIALESRIQRRNVYDVLKQLKEKAFCSETQEQGIRKFIAIHPRRLLDLNKEREAKIRKTLPSMNTRFEAFSPVEKTMVYRGFQAIKNMYWDVIQQEKDLWVIGGRGNWLDEKFTHFFPRFNQERLAKNIKLRHLFYHELKDPNHPKHKITKILQNNTFRFLSKGFNSSCSIEIYADRVASMYWDQEPFVVVIVSSKIAEGYRNYFELLWKNATE